MSAKSVGAATFGRSESEVTFSQPERHRQNGGPNWLAIAQAWWWEVSSALVSAICMGLILIILTQAEGLTLEEWTLPIQPNSLISVFTTIGKSALMVTIAGCLSQLAWQHFASGPKSLDHIRVFDDASRGPWGATELFFVIGKKSYLARLLAVATVLALGIEPFAQQILEFGNRHVEYPIPSVEIAAATTYQSRAFRNDEQWHDDPDKLSRVVIRDNDISNAILGVKSQPYFHCPPSANNCTYPAFTTLGVCGAVTDMAEGFQPRCERGATSDLTCTFRWGTGNMSITFNNLVDPKNSKGARQHEVFRLRVEPTSPFKPFDGLSMTAIRANSSEVFNYIRTGIQPKIELLGLRWYWCTQTFPWTNASSAHLLPSPPVTEPLTALSLPNSTDEWLTFTSSTAQEYRIHRETHLSVWDYLGTKILTSHVLMNTEPSASTPQDPNPSYHLGTEQGTCHSTLEMFLYASNLRNVTQNIAALLSNYIRSRTSSTPYDPSDPLAKPLTADDNVLPGDNNNATVLTGSAWRDETYIEVRWVWLSVPLGETLLAILLLVTTIVSAKLSGVPVLGSSPLGLLFHGLERGAEEAGPVPVENRRAMVGVARGMEVQFTQRERDGGLGFRVVDGSGNGKGGVDDTEGGFELRERGGKGELRVEVLDVKGG
ncbi:hypothetical protein B0T16DRAFT_455420 [Cercophora newfieldiana]|uniref:Uncharacterized protein n=1 Tax=Cercophora newfieldiana TaxID=92897 RepID=A0AA39YKB9_9PEZI|nr:hypothetical protein B0T16DRAFT_455420 [Cercophora newfieldiana]